MSGNHSILSMGGFKFARGAVPFIGTFGVNSQKLCSLDGNRLKNNNQQEREANEVNFAY